MYRILFLIILLTAQLYGVDQIKIDTDRDPRFLKYKIKNLGHGQLTTSSNKIVHPALLYKQAILPNDSAIMINAYNGDESMHEANHILLEQLIGNTIEENPLRMLIKDVCTFKDDQSDSLYIAAACYQNDSVYIITIKPFTNIKDTLFLCTGEDRDNDGKWLAEATILGVFDYDYDSREEIFVWVNAVSDKIPREIYCIDPNSLRIEWSVPYPSSIDFSTFSIWGDSSHPWIVLSSYGPSNGIAIDGLSDRYGYVSVIDSNGEYIFNRVANINFGCTAVAIKPSASEIYIGHTTDLLPSLENESDTVLSSRITILNDKFETIKSVEVEDDIERMWIFDYKMDGTPNLYVMLDNYKYLIFDMDLNLLAKTGRAHLGTYLGEIILEGKEESVMAFSKNGITLYSNDFRKIAEIDIEFGFSYYLPVILNPDSSVNTIYAASSKTELQATIKRRSFFIIIGIYIYEYRLLFIAIFFAALGGIAVMNYYRMRTKKNLIIIENQKKELELATETIARQRAKEAVAEQYKIASGHFRHEINNALGAVKDYVSNIVNDYTGNSYNSQIQERITLLNEVLSNLTGQISNLKPETKEKIFAIMDELNDINSQHLKGLDDIVLKGVNTGLNLAEKLRKHERIEHENNIQAVNINSVIETIVKERSSKLEADNINVKIESDDRIVLNVSEELISILFRNLLINSIDALTEKKSGAKNLSIRISKDKDNKVKITWMDTGSGIPESDQERIFQPFYTTKPTSGSGLGLPMVQKIVEKYGGEIKVESKINEYTKFYFVF